MGRNAARRLTLNNQGQRMNANEIKNIERLQAAVVAGIIPEIDIRISKKYRETSFEVYEMRPLLEVRNFLTPGQMASDNDIYSGAAGVPFFTLPGAVALLDIICLEPVQ